MADEQRHVVLAQPGDVLILSGVGPLDLQDVDRATEFFQEVGIKVAMFTEQVHIDLLEEWAVEFLQEDDRG